MKSKAQCEIVEKWDDILFSFPEKKQDIYFTKKYLSLYESSTQKAQCVICREDDKIMIMPFLKSEIKGFCDFETAYGYGGPISNTDNNEWCNAAFFKIHDYLGENNYICGFTRFHPILHNELLISQDIGNDYKRDIQIVYDRKTIAINTSKSIEDIWTKQISSKNRNMIRKAEKNDLVYKTEYNFDSYNEFKDIYRSTMQRLSADDFYFFNDDYFEKLRRNLSGCSFLGTVRKNDKLICAAIFMYSKLYGHYHLEGSDKDYSNFGANNLLLWKAACEMHNLGIQEFHLGGGTGASVDDSLYKFKKSFSKNEKKFYIGKQIFKLNQYEEICNEWEENNSEKISTYGNRLLKYRY